MSIKSLRGRRSEEAASRVLRERGYLILGRNRIINGVEVDILVRSPRSHLILFEVKTASQGQLRYGLSPYHDSQQRRQNELAHLLSLATNCPVGVGLVIVTPETNDVLIFDPSEVRYRG